MRSPYQSMLARIGAEEFECRVPYPMKGTPDRVEKMRVHRAALAMRLRRFREALEDEFHTWANPQADILWERAWDLGHANGWANVLHWYDALASQRGE